MSADLKERLRFNSDASGHSLFEDALARIEELERQLAEAREVLREVRTCIVKQDGFGAVWPKIEAALSPSGDQK